MVLGNAMTIIGTSRLLEGEPIHTDAAFTAAPIVAHQMLGFGASGSF
jgi:hypothetical protein